jgi:hypothetical protein
MRAACRVPVSVGSGLASRSVTRVRIVGDHPHRGESGTVRDDKPMRFGMWEIDLDPGPGIGGASGCFSGPENLRPLPADEDPA